MVKSKSGIRGFFRINITEDGKGIVGDSGWCENQITNDGISQYLATWLVTGSGGKFVSHMALGTGGAPAASDTVLSGEIFDQFADATTNSRASVATSIPGSKTAQFVASFLSANSFVTAAAGYNISNVGLFNSILTSAGNVGTLFAGNTFASSSCASNQNVNVTYAIQFS